MVMFISNSLARYHSIDSVRAVGSLAVNCCVLWFWFTSKTCFGSSGWFTSKFWVLPGLVHSDIVAVLIALVHSKSLVAVLYDGSLVGGAILSDALVHSMCLSFS